MESYSVVAKDVSKKYCRGLKAGMMYAASDVVRDTFGVKVHSTRLRKGEFWALDGVTFDLRQGECLGLVGRNGAGKSTLLKMLNGIIRPDRGEIRIRGRIGALIEVGAGFHPMLTGRENIYINGAILGLSTKEIDEKYDEIVAFSGLAEDVLDAPVKSYSSGMYVRLGFAVAAHCDPDVLLIDEVLAVGDTSFWNQCYKRIHEIRDRGTTIILVSHSDLVIMDICSRAVLIDGGRVAASGAPNMVLSAYREALGKAAANRGGAAQQVFSDGSAAIERIALESVGQAVDRVVSGSPMRVRIAIRASRRIPDAHFSIGFYRQGGSMNTSFCTDYEGVSLGSLKRGKSELTVDFPSLNLPTGVYSLSAVLGSGNTINRLAVLDVPAGLTVDHDAVTRGEMPLSHSWTLSRG